MFHNILAAFDGSRSAELALEHAIELSECSGARLTVMTAAEQPPPLAYWAPGGAATAFELTQTHAADVAQRAPTLVANRVPATCVVSEEPARQAIVRQIISAHHDLVVIGSRGRGPISAELLGSVSYHVLNHSPVPVLVVHANR